ncbi:ABC-2 type transport system permease protein [Streptoalloteichus tenebrarius]|uniref:ABC-2 type transport system permease protein n=1 Tax=Streptoalloteichus tenebrarius (strain ATCC 17920 / DSM 40477 / JCM 4838 / CBS 697.72 / NBRC 16177 / NCIMB 11028 / NRRL B-12390 / A12253. 1 / ISP 5477) TaxID=1933 RepID=A0ABT1I3I9_STRSD|nr:hypothetical protein [Streptoalloteichus tenebrarius]MCP2262337.1 ABC-2 type transport system permease protein [Streptoalloteichus tenebrarius]BFF02061.1 ABC transporter permease [Streptoalloteichus tenebrarius]
MNLLAVERIKLFSTRSPWWSMLAALVLMLGMSTLFAAVLEPGALEVAATQVGYDLALMVVMVMATLAVTTEYRFNTIKVSFQATPRRSAVLLAKTVVVAVLAGLLGEIAAFGSWGLARLVRPEADLRIDTAAEWRQVAGVGLVWALGAVLAVAVGALLRQTAGAVTLLLVYALLVESLVGLIPKVGQNIRRWLPFTHANHFVRGGGQPAEGGQENALSLPFGPWGSLAYFAGVVLVILVLALVTVNRRDA